MRILGSSPRTRHSVSKVTRCRVASGEIKSISLVATERETQETEKQGWHGRAEQLKPETCLSSPTSLILTTIIIPSFSHALPKMDAEEDTFTSVTWENRDTSSNSQPVFSTTPSFTSNPNAIAAPSTSSSSTTNPTSALTRDVNASDDPTSLSWTGYLMVQVLEPRKELEGQKDAFISYGIRAETNLPHFSRTYMATRRRFNDFTFLREGLKRDFPACVVAPLPDKHRLEYLTGDRFSTEFIEKRTQDLQLFLERICRHPTLQRSQLLCKFLESSEWQVDMHAHTAQHSSTSNTSASALISGSQVENAGPPSLLDSLSDHFLNAFSKVRKPDERFEEIRESIDKLEESLAATERVLSRNRNRIAGKFPFSPPFFPPTPALLAIGKSESENVLGS